jgi:hypothetical protein
MSSSRQNDKFDFHRVTRLLRALRFAAVASGRERWEMGAGLSGFCKDAVV